MKPSGPFLSVYHDEEFNLENADIEVSAEVAGSFRRACSARSFDPGLLLHGHAHTGPYDDFSPCLRGRLWNGSSVKGMQSPARRSILYVKGCEAGGPPEEYVTQIYFPIKK